MPHLINGEENAVYAAPKDEIEACSVPESTKEHRDEEVDVLTNLSMTVSSE